MPHILFSSAEKKLFFVRHQNFCYLFVRFKATRKQATMLRTQHSTFWCNDDCSVDQEIRCTNILLSGFSRKEFIL